MDQQMVLACVVLIGTVFMLFHPKISNGVAASAGAAAMVLIQVIEPRAMYNNYTSNSIVLMVGMMVVGGGMFHTGFAGWLGRTLTRFTGTSERGIQATGLIIGWFLSSVCSASAALMITFPIVCSLCIASKVSMSKVMLPTFAGTGLGTFMTYSGSNMTPAASAILEEAGYEAISYFEVTPYGIARSIVGAILIIWVGSKFLPDTYVKPNAAAAAQADELPSELTGKMIISAVILVATIVGMVIDSSYIPMQLCAVIGALLSVLTGCLSEKEMFKSISWSAVFLIGGMSTVAKGIELSGVGDAIATGILSAFGNTASPLLMLIVIYLVSAVITQFMSNTAAIAIVAPIGIMIANNLGADPRPFVMAALFASCIGNCTPMATTMVGFAMDEGGYNTKDILKFGVFECVASIVVMVIVFPIFFM